MSGGKKVMPRNEVAANDKEGVIANGDEHKRTNTAIEEVIAIEEDQRNVQSLTLARGDTSNLSDKLFFWQILVIIFLGKCSTMVSCAGYYLALFLPDLVSIPSGSYGIFLGGGFLTALVGGLPISFSFCFAEKSQNRDQKRLLTEVCGMAFLWSLSLISLELAIFSYLTNLWIGVALLFSLAVLLDCCSLHSLASISQDLENIITEE